MNPNLKNLDDDFLYHLGFSKSDGLDVLFGDVKVNRILWFYSVHASGTQQYSIVIMLECQATSVYSLIEGLLFLPT